MFTDGKFTDRSRSIERAQRFLRHRALLNPIVSSATKRTVVRDIALGYLAAGVNIIPLRLGGGKSPAIRKWGQDSDGAYLVPFPEDVAAWFATDIFGIALECGIVSDGLEVLDFDWDAEATYAAWLQLIPSSLATQLITVVTGSGGRHVLYRCSRIGKNSKIALAEKGRVMIESRGQGGYVVAVGSPPEVHRTGNPYYQLSGPPLPEIPKILPTERKLLWDAARTFNKVDILKQLEFDRRASALRRHLMGESTDVDNASPWGDFNLRASWAEILIAAGWTSTDREGKRWARPGKAKGTSARIYTHDGTGLELLSIFSTTFECGNRQHWPKFDFWCAALHDGIRPNAVRAAILQGYGLRGRRLAACVASGSSLGDLAVDV